jgi:ribosomal protein S18 acetylase RimI-like enzyme
MNDFVFTQEGVSLAGEEDITALTKLLNSAYRGDASRQGWTTEAELIGGETRTVEEEVRQLILQPDSVFLKYPGGEMLGCVNLRQQGDRLYLGMLSVRPDQQNAGIGKILLQAADDYARSLGCRSVYMTVISARKELIAWYVRHGFKDTGIRKPFIEDAVSGRHLQPLEFAVLEKVLNQ